MLKWLIFWLFQKSVWWLKLTLKTYRFIFTGKICSLYISKFITMQKTVLFSWFYFKQVWSFLHCITTSQICCHQTRFTIQKMCQKAFAAGAVPQILRGMTDLGMVTMFERTGLHKFKGPTVWKKKLMFWTFLQVWLLLDVSIVWCAGLIENPGGRSLTPTVPSAPSASVDDAPPVPARRNIPPPVPARPQCITSLASSTAPLSGSTTSLPTNFPDTSRESPGTGPPVPRRTTPVPAPRTSLSSASGNQPPSTSSALSTSSGSLANGGQSTARNVCWFKIQSAVGSIENCWDLCHQFDD